MADPSNVISSISDGLTGFGSTALGLLGIGNTLANQDRAQENFENLLRFQKYQYEDSKRYNSMVQQVNRMRAAGINPALALGAGQLGTSSSPVSSPSSPSFENLPVGDIMSGASSLLGVGSSNRLNNSKATAQEIDNVTRNIKNWQEIENMREEWQKMNYGNKKLGFDTNYERMKLLFRTGIRNQLADTANKNALANYNDALTSMVDLQLNWLPQEKKAQILKIASEIALNYGTVRNGALLAKSAWRNALKQDGIFFGDNNAKESDFINAAISRMVAAGFIQSDWSDSFSGGAKFFGTGGEHSWSHKGSFMYNPYTGETHKVHRKTAE